MNMANSMPGMAGQPTSANPSSMPYAQVPPQPQFSPAPSAGFGGSATAAISAWLQRQKPLFYWRVLLGGFAAWAIAVYFAVSTQNVMVIPQIMLVGAAVVPFCAILFWYEQCGVTISLGYLALALAGGVTLGLSLGGWLDTQFVTDDVKGNLMAGVCEEAAKALVVMLVMRYAILPHRLHGLLVGVAVGSGFAFGETMGYGFTWLLSSKAPDFAGQLATMNTELIERAVLAIFGHMTWTGIVGAALWRERRGTTLNLSTGVLQAYGIAALLHGLWDVFASSSQQLTFGQIELPVFDFFFVGPVSLIILSFFVYESRQRDQLNPAMPIPPFGDALMRYLRLIGRSLQGQATVSVTAPTASYPYPPSGMAVPPQPPTYPHATASSASTGATPAPAYPAASATPAPGAAANMASSYPSFTSGI